MSKQPPPCKDVVGLPQIQTKYFTSRVDLDSFEVMILTSKESLKALLQSHKTISLDALCVSKKTAAFARSKGINVLQSAQGYGEHLCEIIKKSYFDKKLYFPRATVVAFDLVSALEKEGISVTDEAVYETVCTNPQRQTRFQKGDIFIFTAPSTVECFLKNYEWDSSYKAVAIGKTTYDALNFEAEKYIAQKTTIQSSIEKARSLQC